MSDLQLGGAIADIKTRDERDDKNNAIVFAINGVAYDLKSTRRRTLPTETYPGPLWKGTAS